MRIGKYFATRGVNLFNMKNFKEKIVLVNPPNKKIVLRDLYSSTVSKGLYNWPCIDLLVLSGILKNDFDVSLVDANTLKLSNKNTLDLIKNLNPIGVVFAFGNSVKRDDYKFVRELRSILPDAKLCGTGGLLYHNSENELKNNPEFDACLLNFTTDDIVKYFNNDLSNISNIVYRNKNGKIIRTLNKNHDNSFSYPIPLHEHLPLDRYQISHGRSKPLTTILTAFGCPFKCSFCVSGRIDWDTRNIDNILEELSHVKRLGVKEIFFRDNVFGAKKKECSHLFNKMIENEYNFSWVADTRVEYIDKDFASLMKKSGCHSLHMGVEVGSDQVRSNYNKKMRIDKIKDAFKICNEVEIQTVGYFILGLPGEKASDIKQTIELAIELDCDYASFNNAIPIVGTDLRDKVIKDNLIENINDLDIYDGSFTPIIETKELTREEVNKLRSLALRKFYFRPRYILKRIKGVKNIFQFKMLLLEGLRLTKALFINKKSSSDFA